MVNKKGCRRKWALRVLKEHWPEAAEENTESPIAVVAKNQTLNIWNTKQ
jgi:hypothetical protein